MTTILIAAAILTGMIFFILGGIIGYLIASSGVSINNKVSKFSNSQANKMAKINIDDTKFVVDIKIDELEKKYEQLGDIKQSNDNISGSINKLKNMKR
jgi:cytochrome c biogenesis protein ResB